MCTQNVKQNKITSEMFRRVMSIIEKDWYLHEDSSDRYVITFLSKLEADNFAEFFDNAVLYASGHLIYPNVNFSSISDMTIRKGITGNYVAGYISHNNYNFNVIKSFTAAEFIRTFMRILGNPILPI